MNTATLKRWSIASKQNGYMPAELAAYYLHGDVYGDSAGRFGDGQSIHTSTIRAVTDHGTHKVVKTKNSAYCIYPADIDPEYERIYPGAYGRIPAGRKQGEHN